MAGWLRRTFADPHIGRHLLRDEGEVIVDEVLHHWVVYIGASLELLFAVCLVVLGVFAPIEIAWLPWVVAIVVASHAGWHSLSEYMDRFVITNMRVFRVKGVLAQKMATMPLGRILDITVEKPIVGRVFGYGHFVFESAAQEQGLRDIRYVGRPDQRDLVIQRVIARAGLRGPRSPTLQ